jgi:hypothetical protein
MAFEIQPLVYASIIINFLYISGLTDRILNF